MILYLENILPKNIELPFKVRFFETILNLLLNNFFCWIQFVCLLEKCQIEFLESNFYWSVESIIPLTVVIFELVLYLKILAIFLECHRQI